jgi:diaminopropionate ammonia-lyase
MLAECDDQIPNLANGELVTHVVVPVGAGSIAQAVTQHYKSMARNEKAGTARVVAVEAITSACLMESLKVGDAVSVDCGHTIMFVFSPVPPDCK